VHKLRAMLITFLRPGGLTCYFGADLEQDLLRHRGHVVSFTRQKSFFVSSNTVRKGEDETIIVLYNSIQHVSSHSSILEAEDGEEARKIPSISCRSKKNCDPTPSRLFSISFFSFLLILIFLLRCLLWLSSLKAQSETWKVNVDKMLTKTLRPLGQ
jgi:hypothetical protein